MTKTYKISDLDIDRLGARGSYLGDVFRSPKAAAEAVQRFLGWDEVLLSSRIVDRVRGEERGAYYVAADTESRLSEDRGVMIEEQ